MPRWLTRKQSIRVICFLWSLTLDSLMHGIVCHEIRSSVRVVKQATCNTIACAIQGTTALFGQPRRCCHLEQDLGEKLGGGEDPLLRHRAKSDSHSKEVVTLQLRLRRHWNHRTKKDCKRKCLQVEGSRACAVDGLEAKLGVVECNCY